MSPIKETNFFSTDFNPNDFSEHHKKVLLKDLSKFVEGPMTDDIFSAFITDEKIYQKLFKNVTNEIAIGEVTPGYVYSKSAAVNIKKSIPDCKIVIVLRNPVKRAFSHYLMFRRMGVETLDFHTSLKNDIQSENKIWGNSKLYIEQGLYYEQVMRFIREFPANQLKIIVFEDFVKEPGRIIKDLFRFIGVDDMVNLDFAKKHNESEIPRVKLFGQLNRMKKLKSFFKKLLPENFKMMSKQILFTKKNLPKLETRDKELMISLFREDVNKLEKLLGRDLSFWLK